ncbi:MAG: HEAT repeat domain-containing protein [Phycisphaerales bacterium]|jgi:hypothetical protein|nr:HEAT repeat domain-containing protein [Phycisphaerales bacterium]
MRMFVKTSLLSVMILCACGCDGKLEDAGIKTKKFVSSFSDPHPRELTQHAFDDTVDPDLRRQAVISLSSNDWGLTETYLDGYDVILRAEMRKSEERRDTALMSATIGALNKGGDPKYIPVLVLALRLSKSPQVRWDAVIALDNVVGDKAIEQLCKSSDMSVEKSTDVRAACCTALRHYVRQDVIDTLVRCLAPEEEFGVRYAAHKTLVKLCGRDFGTEYTDWAGTKLDKLPALEVKKETKSKSMWNPLNWFG